jgi:hypothetical protein
MPLRESMSRNVVLIITGLILTATVCLAVWWAHRSPFGSSPMDVASLGNFTLDQVKGADADIPQSVRELDGKRIILLGEMWQPMSNDNVNVSDFDLMRFAAFHDYQVPQVQQFVRCKVSSSRKVTYCPNTVTVTGVLHVGIERDGGRISSVLTMEVERVEATL